MEVLRRYSNRTDLIRSIIDVRRRIEAGDQADEPGVGSTGRGGALAPVRERLGEAAIQDLVVSRRDGTSIRMAAARYGVSESSVKRILEGV